LPPAKGDQVKALGLGEMFDGGDKGPCDFGHGLGRGKVLATMRLEEIGDAAFRLQARLNDIEVESVQTLDGERDVIPNDIGDGNG
jgi:hypothetical protein